MLICGHMKNFKNFLIISLFAIALVLPQDTSAYETTEQAAVRINDNTVLYTITYKFGFLNRETFMPIGAVRGLENASSSDYVGYDILNKDQIYKGGEVNALVLSTAKIKENQYYLPEGKAGYFTLVALVTVPNDGLVYEENLNLKINHLPFTMVKTENNKETKVYLSREELEDYVSPLIK